MDTTIRAYLRLNLTHPPALRGSAVYELIFPPGSPPIKVDGSSAEIRAEAFIFLGQIEHRSEVGKLRYYVDRANRERLIAEIYSLILQLVRH